jgi:hypothetical protein
MGAAQYWDDPDADLERTVDLPVPPTVRARFEPTPREVAILEEVVHALRMIGVVLAVISGVIALTFAQAAGPDLRRAVALTGLVLAPGVLYLVAAAGLVRRRYWAWVMSATVTGVMMLALLGFAMSVVAGMTEPVEAFVLVPLALLLAMPSLILAYMLRARPVIRDAELLVGSGFDVLPAHQDEAAAESPPPPSPLAAELKPDDSGTTSPSPAPPAP